MSTSSTDVELEDKRVHKPNLTESTEEPFRKMAKSTVHPDDTQHSKHGNAVFEVNAGLTHSNPFMAINSSGGQSLLDVDEPSLCYPYPTHPGVGAMHSYFNYDPSTHTLPAEFPVPHYGLSHCSMNYPPNPSTEAMEFLSYHQKGSSGTSVDMGLDSSTPSNGKPKRKRVATVAQRRAANQRERRRMCNLNEAFDMLRKRVPTFAYEKRLSRIETLRLTITYIAFMTELLQGKKPEDIKLSPPRTMTWFNDPMHSSQGSSDSPSNLPISMLAAPNLAAYTASFQPFPGSSPMPTHPLTSSNCFMPPSDGAFFCRSNVMFNSNELLALEGHEAYLHYYPNPASS